MPNAATNVPEPAVEEVTHGPVPFVLSRRRRASDCAVSKDYPQ